MEIPAIDERHRKELLGFLLVKTAAVRQGIKPAELLRVRHCYSSVNSEGLRVCLYRSDIYGILGLDYIELKVEAESSLVLFYNPAALASTLAEKRNRRWLARLGYPDATSASLPQMLGHLVRRAKECNMLCFEQVSAALFPLGFGANDSHAVGAEGKNGECRCVVEIRLAIKALFESGKFANLRPMIACLMMLLAALLRAAEGDMKIDDTNRLEVATSVAKLVFDTSNAPDMRQWTVERFAPTTWEWVVKLADIMASDGWTPPKVTQRGQSLCNS